MITLEQSFSSFEEASVEARSLAKEYKACVKMNKDGCYWYVSVPEDVLYNIEIKKMLEKEEIMASEMDYCLEEGYIYEQDPVFDECLHQQQELYEERTQYIDEFYLSYEEGWFYND